MKRLFLQYICLVLLFAGNLGLLNAFEMELTVGANGMTFHPDKSRAYIDTGDTFNAYPYGLGNFSIRNDISEALAFDISIERDNILQNSATFKLFSRTDYFRFEIGPFLGLTDNFDIPDAGMTGGLEFTYPGVIFLSISGSSTLGSQLDFTSDNSREAVEVKLGFWLGNLIPSFSINTRNLTRQKEEFLIISDTLTRMQASADFYAKNTRFTGRFDAGYQTYTRSYKRGNLEYIDELSAWFAGFEFCWQVSQSLRLKTGLEVPFLISPVQPLTVTPEFWFLSRASAGFIYTFN